MKRPDRMASAEQPLQPGQRAKRGASYLAPAEFEELMSKILGGAGWKTRLCELINVQPSAITRWCNGTNPIPKWLAVLTLTLSITPPPFMEDMRSALPVDNAEFHRKNFGENAEDEWERTQ